MDKDAAEQSAQSPLLSQPGPHSPMNEAVVLPRPVRRKRPISACRCCLLLSGMVVALPVLYGLYQAVGGFLGGGFSLLDGVFSDTTQSDPSLDILPLFGKHDTFDIALTIWARKADNDTEYAADYIAALNSSLLKTASARDQTIVNMITHAPPPHPVSAIWTEQLLPPDLLIAEVMHIPDDVEVFGEIIAQDVSLASLAKPRQIDVSYELPLKRFYDKMLLSDVRAVVTLIPPQAVMERIDAVLTSMPQNITLRPSAGEKVIPSWATSSRHRQVLQSLSTEVPLLDPKGDLKPPSVLTRAQFAIFNETRPINHTVFSRASQEQGAKSCGRKLVRGGHRLLCDDVGMDLFEYWFRSSFKLQPEGNHDTGNNSTSRNVYRPMVSPLLLGAGPKHRKVLPVTRNVSLGRENDPKSVTVPLTVSIGSPGIGRYVFIAGQNTFPVIPWNKDDRTARQEAEDHGMWEVVQGAWTGMPIEGTHPWRRFVLSLLSFPLVPVHHVLQVLYLWTRTTTAGISFRGLYLFTASWFFQVVVSALEHKGGIGFGTIFSTVLELIPLVCALSLVLPWTLDGWTLRHRHMTHRERATARKDVPLLPLLIATAVAISVGLSSRLTFYFITPDVNETSPGGFLIRLLQTASGVTSVAAVAAQIVVNTALGSFAGAFALDAYVTVGLVMITWVYQFEHVVGVYGAKDGLGMMEVVEGAIYLVFLWQAMTLPRVEQVVEEEEE